MHRRLSAKCIPLMRILTCTRVQSRFGEGLENRPEEGCAEGGRGCFVVGRTSEGKTWWPLVAAFIRGGTLRTFWDLSSLLSALFSVPPPPFSFSLFHHDRSRVYTTIVVPKGGGGFVRRKKKKKLFHWELFAIKKKREPAFVGSFPNLIFHDAGEKKIFRPYLHLLSATWKRIIALLPESTVYERFWKVPRFHGYARGECIVSLKGAVSNVMSVFRQLLLFRSSGLEWLVIQHLLKFLK